MTDLPPPNVYHTIYERSLTENSEDYIKCLAGSCKTLAGGFKEHPLNYHWRPHPLRPPKKVKIPWIKIFPLLKPWSEQSACTDLEPSQRGGRQGGIILQDLPKKLPKIALIKNILYNNAYFLKSTRNVIVFSKQVWSIHSPRLMEFVASQKSYTW